MARDVFSDAEARYEEAVARRLQILEEWQALECPLLERGSTGQLVEHPLVKMLREHDSLVDRLAEPLRKRHRGPDPSAVVRAKVRPSKAAKLRSVG